MNNPGNNKEDQVKQNMANITKNQNKPTNDAEIKGMIGKLSNQIKTIRNQFKKLSDTYISNLSIQNIKNFVQLLKRAETNLDNAKANKNMLLGNNNQNNNAKANKNTLLVNNNVLSNLKVNLNSSITIFEKRINTQKKAMVAKIPNFLKNTFVDPLEMKKESLTQMANTLQQITPTLKKTLGKNGELTPNNINTIKNAYQKFTTNSSNFNKLNNQGLKKNFSNLKNNLTKLNINLNNTNQLFNTFNSIFKKTAIVKNQNSRNINSLFNQRIKKINESIQQKTTYLTKIVNKINFQINDLKQALGNNTLNKAITDQLSQLIDQMNGTITTMDNDTKQQQIQLTKMVGSLRQIIGTKNNKLNNSKNPTIKGNIKETQSEVLKNNSINQGVVTGKGNNSNNNNKGNVKGSSAVQKKTKINLTNAAQKLSINKKALNILKNQTNNKPLPVTFTTQKGNINGTIKKNSNRKITYLNNNSVPMNSTKISNIKAKTTQPLQREQGESSAALSTPVAVVDSTQVKNIKKRVNQLNNSNINKIISYKTSTGKSKTAQYLGTRRSNGRLMLKFNTNKPPTPVSLSNLSKITNFKVSNNN